MKVYIAEEKHRDIIEVRLYDPETRIYVQYSGFKDGFKEIFAAKITGEEFTSSFPRTRVRDMEERDFRELYKLGRLRNPLDRATRRAKDDKERIAMQNAGLELRKRQIDLFARCIRLSYPALYKRLEVAVQSS